ncbi:MAG: response regulator [Chloroflexota bacterium]
MTHTVLIVDDSPTTAPELRAQLEREGYQVLIAFRGEEALDTLRSTRVHLVITETLLPGMDGFELVRQMRNLPAYGDIPIVMYTVRSAPEDYAASFEAGANEYFVKTVEARKIHAAIRGLLARHESGRLERPGPGTKIATTAGLPSRAERGQVITFFSLKGGVGTTTLAVNLAVAIKQAEPSARVGLMDLALEEGHVALLLDIVPTSTMTEWAREDLTDATPHMLNQYFVQHRSGVAMLAAPLTPEHAETVSPTIVRTTLELAPLAFDYVVVDTSSNFSENSLTALECADTIFLPLTPELSAMKCVVNTMRVLDALHVKKEKIRILQNEIVPRAGLTREQLETGLGKKFESIPHGGATFMEAANQGVPVVTVQPLAAAARAIVDVARTVCTPDTDAAAPPKVGVALLRDRLRVLRRT